MGELSKLGKPKFPPALDVFYEPVVCQFRVRVVIECKPALQFRYVVKKEFCSALTGTCAKMASMYLPRPTAGAPVVSFGGLLRRS